MVTKSFIVVCNLVVWPGLISWIYILGIVARLRGFGSVWKTWAIHGEFIRIVSEESRPHIKRRYKVALCIYSCSIVSAFLLFAYAIYNE